MEEKLTFGGWLALAGVTALGVTIAVGAIGGVKKAVKKLAKKEAA